MFIGNVLKTQRVVVGFDTYRGESKMKIAITILLLIFTIKLSATPIDEFNQIIKETNINQSKYENITFDNIENNQTQQEAKALFEQILPYYLKTQTLFSKERLERLNHEQIVIDANDKNSTIPSPEEFTKSLKDDYYLLTIRDIRYHVIFFRMVNSYLKSIENNSEQWDELAQKALDDIVQLIDNSMNSGDYAYGLSMLEKIYKVVDKQELLKSYPPPSKELLYQKIEQDKCNLLDGWRVPMYTKRLTKKGNVKANAEMRSFADKVEKRFEPYIEKYIEVLRGGSKKELEAFKVYQQKEEKRVYDGKVKIKSEVYFILLMSAFSSLDFVLYIQELQQKVDKIYDEKVEESDSQNSLWSLYFWYAFLGLLLFYLLWLFLDFLRWVYYILRKV